MSPSRRKKQSSFDKASPYNQRRAENKFFSLDTNLFAGRADSHKWGQASASVTHVAPASTSGESDKQYIKRMHQMRYYERDARNRTVKSKLWIVLASALTVILALFVANIVYKHAINGRMALDDSAINDVLFVPQSGTEGQYILLTGIYQESHEPVAYADALMLAHLNIEKKTITLIGIPSTIQVAAARDGALQLKATYAFQGDSALVSAIEDITGVEIAHYIRTDADGFQGIVNYMNGITCELLDDVYDVDINNETLKKGEQILNSEDALYAARANDFLLGEKVHQAHLGALTESFVRNGASHSGASLIFALDKMSHFIKTDLQVKDITELMTSLKDIQDFTFYKAMLPINTLRLDDGSEVISADKTRWEAMRERIGYGEQPTQDTADIISAVDSSSFDISINNGSSIEGAATKAADILKQHSYKVVDVGNAAMQVYDETLVIYKDDAHRAAAEATVAQLGIGRTVQDSVYYSFDSDVLVVIGADWEQVDMGAV